MMRENTSGSRKSMGDKSTEAYLMSLIDDAIRIASSDPLGEDIPFVSYRLKERKMEKKAEMPLEGLYREAASCHSCQGYEARRTFAEPVFRISPKVLFIAPQPEGQLIFSPDSQEIFIAWWKKSLLLTEREWALSTLIKCPTGGFRKDSADACRPFLREEMAAMKPEAMVLLGRDTAAYMLRRDEPMDALRQRRFVVNHIPVYATYTPIDYMLNPGLKRAIWDDMLFIRRCIGTEERQA